MAKTEYARPRRVLGNTNFKTKGKSNMSAMVAGAAFSWFEPITVRLVEDPELDLSNEDVSWIIAILEIGNFISPLVSGELTNRFGRRLMIMSTGPLCLAGWILVLCSKSILSLIVARILHGLAVGVVFTIPPIYTAEIADPKLRGRLSGIFLLAWFLGSLYSFSAGPYLSYDTFAYACLPFSIIFTILWMFVPETPYYLLMIGQEEKAKEVLKYFRDEDVEEEFVNMKKSVREEMSTEGSWKTLFFDKIERKAFIIVQIVCITKNLTGMSVLENYALEIFSKSESSVSPEIMSILLAVLLSVMGFIGAFLSDWAGRKPMLLLSCFGCFFAHFLSGGYYYIHEKTNIDASNYIWALYIGITMYGVLCCMGIGVILQTLQSEMFGASTRGIAAGVTEGLSSFFALLVIKLYTTINEAYGLYLNFLIYSLVGLVGGILLSCLAYETAGKTIGQMEDRVKKTSVA